MYRLGTKAIRVVTNGIHWEPRITESNHDPGSPETTAKVSIREVPPHLIMTVVLEAVQKLNLGVLAILESSPKPAFDSLRLSGRGQARIIAHGEPFGRLRTGLSNHHREPFGSLRTGLSNHHREPFGRLQDRLVEPSSPLVSEPTLDRNATIHHRGDRLVAPSPWLIRWGGTKNNGKQS